MQETGLNPWVGKFPWRRKWQLQYSCLGNPVDRRDLWAMNYDSIHTNLQLYRSMSPEVAALAYTKPTFSLLGSRGFKGFHPSLTHPPLIFFLQILRCHCPSTRGWVLHHSLTCSFPDPNLPLWNKY